MRALEARPGDGWVSQDSSRLTPWGLLSNIKIGKAPEVLFTERNLEKERRSYRKKKEIEG